MCGRHLTIEGVIMKFFLSISLAVLSFFSASVFAETPMELVPQQRMNLFKFTKLEKEYSPLAMCAFEMGPMYAKVVPNIDFIAEYVERVSSIAVDEEKEMTSSEIVEQKKEDIRIALQMKDIYETVIHLGDACRYELSLKKNGMPSKPANKKEVSRISKR